MITAEAINEINSLEPNEQTVVLSLVKGFLLRKERRTKAQEQFAEECKKYEDKQLTMDEINAILHEEAL